MQRKKEIGFFALGALLSLLAGSAAVFFFRTATATTFNNNTYPGADNVFKIGDRTRRWVSLNGKMYFGDTGIGINVSDPNLLQYGLVVDRSFQIYPKDVVSSAIVPRPTCDVAHSETRGTLWVSLDPAGTNDTVEACIRQANGSYTWSSIYP